MGRKNAIVALAVAVLGVCLIINCSDKGTNPPGHQPDYRLAVNFLFNNSDWDSAYTLIVSTRNDSILHKFYTNNATEFVEFSHDGTLLYHTAINDRLHGNSPAMTWATNWKTGDTLAQCPGLGGQSISISSDDQYMFIADKNPIILFSLPALTPLFLDSVGNNGGIIIPHHKRACHFMSYYPPLSIIDYESLPPQKSTLYLRALEGDTLSIAELSASQSGDTLIIVADRDTTELLLVLASSEDLKVYKEIHISALTHIFYAPVVYPSGRKILLVAPANTFWPADSRDATSYSEGIIYEVDLARGTVTTLLDGSSTDEFFSTSNAVFSPDGGEFYFALGRQIMKYCFRDRTMSPALTSNQFLLGLSMSMNLVDQAK